MIEDRWVDSAGVHLHYLAAGGSAATPLVYVPGALGSAEQFLPEMKRLAPRRCLAISKRGLGKSSAPPSGYGLADRVNDLIAVLQAADVGSACIMAFSMGVPVAIRLAALRPDLVAGLILLDYAPRHRKIAETWFGLAMPHALESGVSEHVVRAMIDESEEIDLAPDLTSVRVPVLVVVGGMSHHVPEPERNRYREAVPHLQLVVFEDSGHEVFKPDYEKFMRLVEEFLVSVDTGTA